MIKRCTLSVLLVLLLQWPSRAQSPVSFRYFFYDSGELFRVLDSTGALVEYTVDPAGNITQTTRSSVSSSAPAILSLSPFTAPPGGTFTIFGQNFSANPASNVVQINGVTAIVVSATATQLVVQVPAGATAGQVTVTVNGVTVTSGPSVVFTPLILPVVTSVTPDGGVSNRYIPKVAVTGANLSGAIFSFSGGASATSASTTPVSATLGVNTSSATRGVYALVATNSSGSSIGTVTAGNHFIVLLSPDAADGPLLSVLNTLNPTNPYADPTNVSNSVTSVAVSVLNAVDPISPYADPSNVSNIANSVATSVLNTLDPFGQFTDPTSVTNETDTALVSLNNTTSGSFREPTATPLSRVTAFAQGTAPTGTLEVGPLNATGRLVAGRMVILGVRAPAGASEVRIFVAGAAAARVTRRPFVFAVPVPARAGNLDLSATAFSPDGAALASLYWTQPVEADAGTIVAGRVTDPDALITVEITGACGSVGICAGLLNTLQIPADGEYRFSGADLRIDGEAIAGPIFLKSGPHRIELSPAPGQVAVGSQLIWRRPDGIEQPIPPESLIVSDLMQTTAGPDGEFRITKVPAAAEALRVRIALPDGRMTVSPWQAPVNGGVTDTGSLTVRKKQ